MVEPVIIGDARLYLYLDDLARFLFSAEFLGPLAGVILWGIFFYWCWSIWKRRGVA